MTGRGQTPTLAKEPNSATNQSIPSYEIDTLPLTHREKAKQTILNDDEVIRQVQETPCTHNHVMVLSVANDSESVYHQLPI